MNAVQCFIFATARIQQSDVMMGWAQVDSEPRIHQVGHLQSLSSTGTHCAITRVRKGAAGAPPQRYAAWSVVSMPRVHILFLSSKVDEVILHLRRHILELFTKPS